MTSFTLSKPQRRKRIFCNKDSPFPVPIATQTNLPPSDDKWNYYTAYLDNGKIFVKHSGDIEQLYRMGFFGKGTLSRHRPHYRHMTPTVKWPVDEQGHQRALQVTTKRKYLRREAWAKSELSTWEEIIEPLPVAKKMLQQSNVIETRHDGNLQKEKSPNGCSVMQSCDRAEKLEQVLAPVSSDVELLEPSAKVAKLHLEMSCEATSQVRSHDQLTEWGQSSWGYQDNDRWATSTKEESADFWSVVDGEKPPEPKDKIIMEQFHVQHDCVKLTVTDNVVDCFGNRSIRDESSENEPLKADKDCGDDALNTTSSHQRNTKESPLDIVKQSVLHASHDHKSCDRKSCDTEQIRSCSDEQEKGDFDARCLSNDDDGELLVVDDTDDSDVDIAMDARLPWRPVVKKASYRIQEHLQLSKEEAFFLSYALGCLVLHDDQKKGKEKVVGVPPMQWFCRHSTDGDTAHCYMVKLDLLTMWRRFCDQDSDFLARYVVYHNLRSKGWVPKSGLKYGSDFVVYKQGPAFYHSTYSVVVRRVSAKDLREVHHGIRREHTWTSLATINRITEQVSKDLMFCYVIEPENIEPDHTRSPACLTQFKVQEVVVQRTVSKQERENPEYILVP